MKYLNHVIRIGIVCLCFVTAFSLQGQGTISGVVLDESGEALIGANIIVQGTTEGTVSDFDLSLIHISEPTRPY